MQSFLSFFFIFIFVHAFYLVLCIEMREVYWKKIKISTDYAFKWLQWALCRDFSYFFLCFFSSPLRNVVIARRFVFPAPLWDLNNSSKIAAKRVLFSCSWGYSVVRIAPFTKKGSRLMGKEFFFKARGAIWAAFFPPPNVHKCTKCALHGHIQPLLLRQGWSLRAKIVCDEFDKW